MSLQSTSRGRVRVGGLLVALSLLSPPLAAQPPAAASMRVLFIGNSFTAYNDLHEMVRAVAAGLEPPVSIDASAIVPGGALLKHHWENQDTVAEIRSGNWDIVVLQGQSMLGNALVLGSPTISDPERFFWPSARLLASAAADAGSRVLLLQTPGQEGVPRNAKALTHAYMTIGEEVGHPVAPVGLVWQRVHAADRALPLWDRDGSHPSLLGSQLAAATLVTALADRRVEVRRVLPELDDATARVFDDTLWRTWTKLRAAGGYLRVARPMMPVPPPLGSGEPLGAGALAGTWRGRLDFFFVAMTPELPQLVLTLTRDGESYAGTARINGPPGSGPPPDRPLEDVQVVANELRFSLPLPGPLGPGRARAVLDRDGTLRGHIEVQSDTRGAHNRGAWSAIRDTP